MVPFLPIGSPSPPKNCGAFPCSPAGQANIPVFCTSPVKPFVSGHVFGSLGAAAGCFSVCVSVCAPMNMSGFTQSWVRDFATDPALCLILPLGSALRRRGPCYGPPSLRCGCFIRHHKTGNTDRMEGPPILPLPLQPFNNKTNLFCPFRRKSSRSFLFSGTEPKNSFHC